MNCQSSNVIYKITCKKPKCSNFVYIGETKRRFADRFSEHKGYVSSKKLEQVCGNDFNQKGHKIEDMSPVIIEHVLPTGDDFLRLHREKYWINQYESVEFGANKQS